MITSLFRSSSVNAVPLFPNREWIYLFSDTAAIPLKGVWKLWHGCLTHNNATFTVTVCLQHSAQGECLDQDLEIVCFVFLDTHHSILCLFLLKRAGYCGYCSSPFIIKIYVCTAVAMSSNLSFYHIRGGVQVVTFCNCTVILHNTVCGGVCDEEIWHITRTVQKYIFRGLNMKISIFPFCSSAVWSCKAFLNE